MPNKYGRTLYSLKHRLDTANGHQHVRYQQAFCFVGAEAPLYFKNICKLYRFMVSQKQEYTGRTELTAYSTTLLGYIAEAVGGCQVLAIACNTPYTDQLARGAIMTL